MSSELEAEQLLSRAGSTADPEAAARLVFEAFLALSRTVGGEKLVPLVDRAAALRPPGGSVPVDFLFHTLAGVVGVRARQPGGPEHLEIALQMFAAHDLTDDALFLECALLATLTLIRPHETRPKFAAHIDRLPLDAARRSRLVAMIGLGDAWAGNLVRGQAEMLEARQLAIAAGRTDVEAEVTSWLIKCEALRGDLDASAEHLAQARDLAGRNGSPWVAAQVTEGAAALRFAQGDTEGWLALLELMVAQGLGGDSGLVFEYRWELATHLAVTGQPERAQALLTGIPDPPMAWPGGPAMAAWRQWILNPDAAATAAFEASLSHLDRPAERLPRARMSWLLGNHHARAHRYGEAMRLLEAACSGYATIGAAGLLNRAAADLEQLVDSRTPTAALAPRDGEPILTGAEIRVAVAVADGLSNRETADRLFVSVKTIEFHLGNIFRKLNLRNRTELARRVSQQV